jgi:hypothetical protein
MNRTNWTAVLVFGGVVLVVLLIGLGLLLVLSGAFGGMMGPGFPGRGGMMGGWCPGCGGTGRLFGSGLLGGLVTLLVISSIVLVPVGLLVLLVLGVVRLARKPSTTAPSPAPAQSCPDCGQPVGPDWKHCPHCGEQLK